MVTSDPAMAPPTSPAAAPPTYFLPGPAPRRSSWSRRTSPSQAPPPTAAMKSGSARVMCVPGAGETGVPPTPSVTS